MTMPRWRLTYDATITPLANGARLRITRLDGRSISCRWDVLQRIKNDMAGEDAYAVEVYPESLAVVNELNMRHLWIVPRELMPDEVGW